MTVPEILDSLSIEHLESGHHHCRPGWIQLRECLFCGSDNYHLGVCLESLSCACWKCGGHKLIEVLKQAGASWRQAKNLLSDLDVSDFVAPDKKRKGLKEPSTIGELRPAHQKYLCGRGFDPAELQRIWKIKGIGIASNLAWRIYIPIFHRTQQVSWTTRSISPNAKQRYISAGAGEESLNHKSTVYGLDFCMHAVVIVEGPIDAWAIGPGAGALFGLVYSPAQLRLLAEVPYRYICLDNAPEAQLRAKELASNLSVFPGQTVNIQIDAKDPGSASEKELNRLRRCARI